MQETPDVRFPRMRLEAENILEELLAGIALGED